VLKRHLKFFGKISKKYKKAQNFAEKAEKSVFKKDHE
jgi:hypothetical protein